jgi:hypothetical protein
MLFIPASLWYRTAVATLGVDRFPGFGVKTRGDSSGPRISLGRETASRHDYGSRRRPVWRSSKSMTLSLSVAVPAA